MLRWQLGSKLPHTVRPFAFDILTNVLLDESFLSRSLGLMSTGRMLVMRSIHWFLAPVG